ncbi:hypothetical protein [Halohasta litorea]|uniref:DUF8147 domain-containing protein n=1 Tax=Halohasta litorea TaxID=869891 RepID=A0ABD6D8B7_9EURY|nr:hypothetical protein [Halohasta litorea]
MTLKPLVYALAAGLAVFLAVGVAVTELASAWIEFSLFVGLPAGIVAGTAAAAAVTFGLSGGADRRLRHIASGLAGFGVGFLLAVIGLGALGVGVVLSMGVAVVVGLVAAVVGYLRGPTTLDPTTATSEIN